MNTVFLMSWCLFKSAFKKGWGGGDKTHLQKLSLFSKLDSWTLTVAVIKPTSPIKGEAIELISAPMSFVNI